MRADREEWGRYVPDTLAGDYLRLGWVPTPRDDCAGSHGEYRVLMVWTCCCGRDRPPEPGGPPAERGRDVVAEQDDAPVSAAGHHGARQRPRQRGGDEAVALAELAGELREQVGAIEQGQELVEAEAAERGEPPT